MEAHHTADLPAHKPDQVYCLVSALEAGFCSLPLDYILDTAEPGSRANLPCLAFLLRHCKSNDTFLFDLGIPKDWHARLTPAYLARISYMTFGLRVPGDAADALATRTSTLTTSATPPRTPAPRSSSVPAGYPHDRSSLFDAALLPDGRTRWIDPERWPPLGPFPHALDFYGDGSLYVVDAGPGHVQGHLNVLARTSDDGGWIFLAGDAAHDHRLLTGAARIARHDVFGCTHGDAEQAALHMTRIRRLMETYPRVRVMLAHDVPWYELAKESGSGFWPGTIDSL